MPKSWDDCKTDAEKIEWLFHRLTGYINQQNGVNGSVSARIKALEEARRQSDKTQS
jgi:hypothetical protein